MRKVLNREMVEVTVHIKNQPFNESRLTAFR